MRGYEMPDILHRSDVLTTALLICFLLMTLLSLSRRKSLKDLVSNFFLPSNAIRKKVGESNQEWRRVLVALLFSLQGAIAVIAATQITDTAPLTPSLWLYLGVYTVVIFLFLVVRQQLYRFVHSVFFTKAQRCQWRDDYDFLFTVESLAFFPLLLLIIYLHLDLKIVLISALSVLLFVKILLLFKCFSTFFRKIYGILHLFVYFCTLEAAPFAVLWTILSELTHGLNLQ